jgi:hypothetical protein
MATAVKKTISLPPDLARQVEEIANPNGNRSAQSCRMPYV